MSEVLAVVQFPHPGGEHRLDDGDVKAWNRGDHKRKYMIAETTHIDPAGATKAGPVCFWGEWEPPSRVIHRFHRDPTGRLPEFVHRPFLEVLDDDEPRQNSDPFVFGDRFIYSNCRQARNAKLRRLAPGSLILFGSKVRGEWVLDTVFVVSDSVPYTVAESSLLDESALVQEVVLGPLRHDKNPALIPISLYRGRTSTESPTGPFSFTPCLPATDGYPRFPRPRLVLEERWISPNITMAARVTPASHDDIAAVWAEINDHIADLGLHRAISIAAPPRLR